MSAGSWHRAFRRGDWHQGEGAGETAAWGVGRGQRVDHGVGRTTAVAGVRGARQAAERAARERLAGTLIGAAGELEVAVAQHAAAAGVIAARERAAAHVRRAQPPRRRQPPSARPQPRRSAMTVPSRPPRRPAVRRLHWRTWATPHRHGRNTGLSLIPAAVSQVCRVGTGQRAGWPARAARPARSARRSGWSWAGAG